MSAASEYAELLKLIEVSGPFISFPIFKEVFPQGLVKDSPDLTREIRELYDGWREARTRTQAIVGPAQREWLGAVVTTLLAWPAEWLVEDNAIPQNLSHFVAQHHETLRPDAALIEGGKPRLLIALLPPAQQPDRRPASTTWNATFATRMAELLHATRVPLGLVTNGERFTLVYAEPGQPTGFADFRAELWFDERLTLRAFRDFLSADALFNRPPEQTLDALYRRSLENQQEVSITLGRQVRCAVELFVAALDRADREGGRALLGSLHEEHIYEAALSLMMRLVFLFFAEERDLLPITNPIYRENYAVTTLHDQLREAADRLGEEVLERRYDAFPRLLATFRAVHSGISHDLAALPAYGGDLFDPGRFPFLEGRAARSDWRETPAQPCPIHNRTVLHLLEALQFLEMKVPGGGRETRRLSFRALDIEQIGHVYEGLLDHTVRRAGEIILGLEGKEQPEMPLSELNRRRSQPRFVEWLAGETGRSPRAIERALQQPIVDDPLRWPEWEQVALYAGLVRLDDNRDPCVIPKGSFYVTAGAARRQTGTQYTPRSLTESVVEHALAPLVYVGPAEGRPPEGWQLKPAGQILDLKICDFACGSAAFLVAAARYLSARLVEAWESAHRQHGANVQITPYGHPSSGLPDEQLIPANPEERGLYALRIVVERCLYGVDRNSLAVEMAKLSLWLLTLQRNWPFTFLDHTIRCGDSLLGVDLKQLATYSLTGDGRQTVLFNEDLGFAAEKREGLMKMHYRPGDQRRLLDAALAKTRRLRAAADLLIATAFESNPGALAGVVSMGLEQQETEAQRTLEGRRPFHWPVEFPEVFLHGGGFDAIIGNPPFMGGKRISTELGREYAAYLKTAYTRSKGAADLCCFFFRRAFELVRPLVGQIGLLATNSIAEGDSRHVGLAPILAQGGEITRARRSFHWPGEAGVCTSQIHICCSKTSARKVLDGVPVEFISSRLDDMDDRSPSTLRENKVIASSQGQYLNGEGFILSIDERDQILEQHPNEIDVIRPYLNGDLFNNSAEIKPLRWAIDFGVMDFESASRYQRVMSIVVERVKPQRDKLTRQVHESRFWLYWDKREAFISRVRCNERVLVCPVVTKYLNFRFYPPHWVFSHKLRLFDVGTYGRFAVLQSAFHDSWTRRFSSTLGETLNYSASDVFDCFPFPFTGPAEEIGEQFYLMRETVMREQWLGFTDLYNVVNNGGQAACPIISLREIQVEMDYAVAAAYGWTDLDLGHGFHETKQGIRYTISEVARREILDRLLALNHERYAQEQAALQSAPKRKPKARKCAAAQPDLF